MAGTHALDIGKYTSMSIRDYFKQVNINIPFDHISKQDQVNAKW